jgi:hypothetical protein
LDIVFQKIEQTMNAVKRVWFTDERIFIETIAGEVFSQPMRFFPRLMCATDAQRTEWTQSHFGLHWEALDEDISFESFTWDDNDPKALFCMG